MGFWAVEKDMPIPMFCATAAPAAPSPAFLTLTCCPAGTCACEGENRGGAEDGGKTKSQCPVPSVQERRQSEISVLSERMPDELIMPHSLAARPLSPTANPHPLCFPARLPSPLNAPSPLRLQGIEAALLAFPPLT